MTKSHPVRSKLGRNVRRGREALDLTQEALAERADLDQIYISGIERGLRNPGIINVAKLAKALRDLRTEVSRVAGFDTSVPAVLADFVPAGQ